MLPGPLTTQNPTLSGKIGLRAAMARNVEAERVPDEQAHRGKESGDAGERQDARTRAAIGSTRPVTTASSTMRSAE